MLHASKTLLSLIGLCESLMGGGHHYYTINFLVLKSRWNRRWSVYVHPPPPTHKKNGQVGRDLSRILISLYYG